MKKNGFTLVELLAVIAILAILVIMALPAVLNMFTKARVDTFENEVKTIYRTAQQNYLLNGGAEVSYKLNDNLKDKLVLNSEIKKSIREYCEKNIASYALPYAYAYRKELPKTISGKISYQDLISQKDEEDN